MSNERSENLHLIINTMPDLVEMHLLVLQKSQDLLLNSHPLLSLASFLIFLSKNNLKFLLFNIKF